MSSSFKILDSLLRGLAHRSLRSITYHSSRRHLSTFQRPTSRLPLFLVEKHGLYQAQECYLNLEFRRFKKAKGRKGAAGMSESDEDGKADEEEDDDEGDDGGENPLLMDDLIQESNDGAEVCTIDVNSLRLDAFCKTAFGTTRTKIEEAFYKGQIYVNGEKAAKKALDLSFQDEIDLVKGTDPEDLTKMVVKRVVIEKLPDKANEQGRVKIQIRKWQELRVDAYPTE